MIELPKEKLCPRCKEILPASFFLQRLKGKLRLRSYCKMCHSATSNKRKGIRDKERKAKAVELFGERCYRCHKSYPPAVYDFHHLDETIKEWTPKEVLNSRSWEVAEEELKKCIMVCSNCHRIIHNATVEDINKYD